MRFSYVCVFVCVLAMACMCVMCGFLQVMTCAVSSNAEYAVDADHTQTVLTGVA